MDPIQRDPIQRDPIQRDLIQRDLSLKQNIDRLHTLAKYKTLFDDKSRDIDLMTHRIKNTLQDISTKIDELEREGLSGYSDVPLTRDGSSHRQTLVAVLRGQMMEGTREFTAALQTRRRTLEILEARKGIYVKDTSNFDIEAQHDDILEVSAGRRGGMVTTMQTYHQSRSEAVEQLQRLIGEVSTMFSRVAGMVSQQEEMVLRIDATMDDSLIRLREGQEQLLKYFSSIKNHRKLILQLLGMLTCFAMFFIVFLA
ncbi:putative syntaxin [Gregarina niphandrodes]|uniref:Syntaxin n=1 Tax=Gregarina niphandrodes TaxID=110365 RepID=A0A023B2Y9_GRENI|nr:putative syntaxin [Gregarina niphandrodes]EZG53785.1 putative syntaxin [Gregarina niphandrodes]|eukprot:XP_011131860.1 putative syntaxin [Gregarina niphandrodes]